MVAKSDANPPSSEVRHCTKELPVYLLGMFYGLRVVVLLSNPETLPLKDLSGKAKRRAGSSAFECLSWVRLVPLNVFSPEQIPT